MRVLASALLLAGMVVFMSETVDARESDIDKGPRHTMESKQAF